MLLGTSATEYATVPLVLNFTDVHEHIKMRIYQHPLLPLKP